MEKYIRKNKISILHKIANNDLELEYLSDSEDLQPEESEVPDENSILSDFKSASDKILSFIKKAASWTPFAAEALSLYFYVLDTEPNIILRATVAAFLMGITGVITIETATTFVTGMSTVATGGAAGPFALIFESIIKGLGAGSLAASLPFAIAIYNILVEDKHVQQAKEFLKSANIKIQYSALNKVARELAVVGDFSTATALMKVAQSR